MFTITIGSVVRVSTYSAPMVHLRYRGSGHKLWRPLGAHSLQLGAVGRGHFGIYAISCATLSITAPRRSGIAVVSFSVVVRRI